MNIKVVLFDAAGVLFPLNMVVGEDLADRFHLSEEQLEPMWKELYIEYTLGKLTTDQFLDTFASMYNLPRKEVTQEIFTESFLKSLSPMPGIEQVLRQLKERSVVLAILSDTGEMFAQARRELLFGHYFDQVFLSFEIGYRKPDARAFQAVIDFYNIPPQEIFFIDDKPAHIHAAKSIGMQGATFTDTEALTRVLRRIKLLS